MIDITGERKGEFWTTLREARLGENIVYHVGQHCAGPHRIDALGAYQKGLATLVQSRVGPGRFAYIAQKTKYKRRKK
jgi:hypothetical protein